MRSATVVAIAVGVALAIRVIPAWSVVFQPAGVNFQDSDSWYHMRAIRNLAAHYPSESGFDPYAVFPEGQVHQSEPWDLAVATVAWILGAGKPGEALVDEVGAWLPAILGALLPIPVFLLGRRLHGPLAGQLSAIAVALIPGTLLWETHLGVPDHHVAECLLSLTILVLTCEAAESAGRVRIRLTVAAGLTLGAYLCVRPAGIFVPAILAVVTLAAPALAPLTMAVVGIAGAVFAFSAGGVWVQFTWLTLTGSLAVCGFAWALDALWRRRQWPSAWQSPAAGIAALGCVAAFAMAKPAIAAGLVATIRRYLPGGQYRDAAHFVGELVPIWEVKPHGAGAFFAMLGGVWLIALPVLICAIPLAWRARRPVLTLCAIWGVVMTVAGVLQLRMLVYASPAVAAAAGVGTAWLVAKMTRFRGLAVAAFVAFLLATGLNPALPQMRGNGGPDADWRAALDWLRRNTPDPMGDAAARSRYWPRLLPGQTFHYPESAYGVLTWWDYGDWVNTIAYRLPSTNGTQAHAEQVARILTATGAESARGQLARLGVRYVVLSSEVMTAWWPGVIVWSGHNEGEYRKTAFVVDQSGRAKQVSIYLPEYYQSLAVRLYIFDGRKVAAPAEVSVFTTRQQQAPSGLMADIVIAVRTFPSAQKALQYMAANSGETMFFGSADPTESCVELEELAWAKKVFASGETARTYMAPTAVKVFEVSP